MDSARSMISSSTVPFRAAGGGGGQVFLFGGSGGFVGGAPLVGGAGAAAGRRKRPFQLTSAHEELPLQLELGDDELCCLGLDHLHGPQPERTATKRRLTAEQVRELEQSFEEEKRKLEPERKSELARRLGITPRQVAVWFQNRRARWRTKQLEQDLGRLRAAHSDLLAGRDALLADNDRLRAQVITLTEKLQAKESLASELKEQRAGIQAAAHALFEEDNLCSEIATGSAAALPPWTNGDSPESNFAGARSPPSSPEDDCCGRDADDDCRSFFLLPDALLAMGVEQQGMECAAEEDGDGDGTQLNNWAWIWNDHQYQGMHANWPGV